MRPLSLRNALIGLFLLGALYVVGMVSFLSVSMTRGARERMEDTERLAWEFEGLGARADTLNQALALAQEGLRDQTLETLAEAEGAGRELTALLGQVQRSGLRLVLQRQQEAVASARRLRALAVFWVVAGAFLVGGALLWLHFRIYRPLGALERGLARVGAGRFDEPVSVFRRDELGRLAEILNWAAGSLKERTETQSRVTRSLLERIGRLMEDSAREIYIFHGDDLHLVQMNGTLREKLQWGDRPLEAATPFDFIERGEELAHGLERLRSGELALLPFSVRHRRRDGTHYPVEGNFQYSGDEEPPVFVAVARDMTEIYDREDRLRQAMKLQAVGQLTGGVAHDFNNLLTVIQGSLDLIGDDLPPGDPNLPLLEEAMAAAERGAALTHQLLAYSRKQALRPRALDLNQLLEEMERMLDRALGEGVEIEVVRAAGLWRCQADPAELKNVLLSLVLNARDAMPLGGKLTIETGNVRLDAGYAAIQEDLEPGQYVVVAVTDTGKGMSAETLSRVFDPFFTTKGVGEGSGLGLSMAFGFAKQSGGHIRLDSELGKGTTARLYLPRVRAEQMELGVPDAPVPPRRPKGGGERILVVEDDPPVLEMACRTLATLGYRTEEARNVEEALKSLRAFPPGTFALLFTDVVLPGGRSGRDLAREAKLHDPDLPVLFTSGYTQDTVIRKGRLDLGVHLLEKPYRVEQLARKVLELIQR